MPSREHFMTEKERRKRDAAEATLILDSLRHSRTKKEEEEEEV